MDPISSAPGATADRLAALERSNRRLRNTVLTLALAFGGLLWMAATSGRARLDEVEAGRFTLLDADGHMAARLEVDGNGLPRMTFWDLESKERVILAVGTEDVALSLRGVDGQSRLGLALDGSDNPHVVLADPKHRPRLHLSVNAKTYGNIILRGDDGTIAAGIGLSDQGEPWVRPTPSSHDGGAPAAKKR